TGKPTEGQDCTGSWTPWLKKNVVVWVVCACAVSTSIAVARIWLHLNCGTGWDCSYCLRIAVETFWSDCNPLGVLDPVHATISVPIAINDSANPAVLRRNELPGLECRALCMPAP